MDNVERVLVWVAAVIGWAGLLVLLAISLFGCSGSVTITDPVTIPGPSPFTPVQPGTYEWEIRKVEDASMVDMDEHVTEEWLVDSMTDTISVLDNPTPITHPPMRYMKQDMALSNLTPIYPSIEAVPMGIPVAWVCTLDADGWIHGTWLILMNNEPYISWQTDHGHMDYGSAHRYDAWYRHMEARLYELRMTPAKRQAFIDALKAKQGGGE